jgi:hypothetical protein
MKVWFGRERVTAIQLLSITKPKATNGYYHTLGNKRAFYRTYRTEDFACLSLNIKQMFFRKSAWFWFCSVILITKSKFFGLPVLIHNFVKIDWELGFNLFANTGELSILL